MQISYALEHNGNDTLLHLIGLPGAFTRGSTPAEALAKAPLEAAAYLRWAGEALPAEFTFVPVQDVATSLQVRDADSDILLADESQPFSPAAYARMRRLVLQSARDVMVLYHSIPDVDDTVLAPRDTFYGPLPRTAREMLAHIDHVHSYYFAQLDIQVQGTGDLYGDRLAALTLVAENPQLLQNTPLEGDWDEWWTLRKVLRRFLWHDRIHARAMWRMARLLCPRAAIADPFYFSASR